MRKALEEAFHAHGESEALQRLKSRHCDRSLETADALEKPSMGELTIESNSAVSAASALIRSAMLLTETLSSSRRRGSLVAMDGNGGTRLSARYRSSVHSFGP